jgi:hypothetical protein
MPPPSIVTVEDYCESDDYSNLHKPSQILVSCLKEAESEAQLLGFWG